MADTTVAPTNQQVRFRGKGASMAKAEIDEDAKNDSTKDSLQKPSKEPRDRASDMARQGLISPTQLAKMRKKPKPVTPKGNDAEATVKPGKGDKAVEGDPEEGGPIEGIKPPKGNKDGDANDE